jgi:hypothetical protein
MGEWMSSVLPLFVFDDFGRDFVLAHRRDYVVGEPGSCSDLVNAFPDLRVKFGMLLVAARLAQRRS